MRQLTQQQIDINNFPVSDFILVGDCLHVQIYDEGSTLTLGQGTGPGEELITLGDKNLKEALRVKAALDAAIERWSK